MKDASWLVKLWGCIEMFSEKYMSFQILDFNFENKKIILSQDKQDLNDDHIFTILTGKNGSGKSRLLVNILSVYLSYDFGKTYKNKPQKIISISNIKNDKFPLEINSPKNYHYIGQKNYPSAKTLDRFYVFKNIFSNIKINRNSICQTFEYLNLKSEIKVEFKSLTPSPYIEINNLISTRLDLYDKFNSLFKKYLTPESQTNFEKYFDGLVDLNIKNYSKYSIINKNFINEKLIAKIDYDSSLDPKITHEKIESLLQKNEILFIQCLTKIHSDDVLITDNIFNKLIEIIIIEKMDFKFKKFGYDFKDHITPKYIENLFIFLNLELIRISDIWISRIDSNENIKFYDLSSGQQSLLNIMLGISGIIEDNSLICIDEPEVNLHPEWQTEFIVKLQNIFNYIKGCHFIIATHSPQIVSGLKSEHGYIVDLEENKTYEAKEYSTRSADFQLAKIFKSPGYNNEYILKLCFHLLSLIKEDQNPTSDDLIALQEINDFKENLKNDDPSLYLIKQVQSFFE